MRYKEFSFSNYKGISEMTLKLDGPVTTLIGLNESGKTTILEAIFCFSYGAEDLEAINPSMASLRDPERWIPISRRGNFNDEIAISAVLELEDSDIRDLKRHLRQEHKFRLTSIADPIKISERYIFQNSRYQKTTRSWILNLYGLKGQQRNPRKYTSSSPEWQECVAYLKAHLPRIWYFPNFLFELPERFGLTDTTDDVVDEERDKGRFYIATFDQVLNQVDDSANLETHVVERLQSDDRADRRSLNSVLLDMGRAITKTILEGWDRIFGRAPVEQEIQLDADIGSLGDPYLELKIKGPDGYYDLSERSLGFRWFFMFLLMTSFHRGNESQKPLFLLDEPASNLHSTAQAELLKSFENLIDTCYLVYTTHSHHLINIRWLDAAYVVKNAALGADFGEYVRTRMGARTAISATKYRQFVADHPDQTSYFQPVLDLLDYRPSTLEPVPDVVLVEGKSDFFLIRYMMEVLGVQSQLKTIPGGGAGSLEPIIRLHIGWAKSFLVLLDGDAEGRKQLARYMKEFGPIVANRCVLLPDACQDSHVKEAEDLLSASDKEQLISRIFAPGVQRPSPKRALRQAIVELYARREPVPVDTSTAERFGRLFTELERLLTDQT